MRRLLQLLTAAVVCTAALVPAASAHADEPTLSIAAVTTPSHLPTWVQTIVRSGTLYQFDTASDQLVTTLGRHTFLRVIDAGTARLEVQAYDQNGYPAQTGWIDADDVQPSAPATDWLVNSTRTTLWSADNLARREIDRFTPLQRLDGPLLNRVLVNVYRPDFSGVVDQGWIDVSATGPALPPSVLVPVTSDLNPAPASTAGTTQQQAFLERTAQAARRASALTRVPASVTLAQAILESDWGRSALARDANNFFGMKAVGALGNDGVVWLATSEYDDSGALYSTISAFRAYKSLADSIADHDQLLATSSRYAPAMQVAADPRQFAVELAADGYSTDPNYADKLIDLMDGYDLYRFDT